MTLPQGTTAGHRGSEQWSDLGCILKGRFLGLENEREDLKMTAILMEFHIFKSKPTVEYWKVSIEL